MKANCSLVSDLPEATCFLTLYDIIDQNHSYDDIYIKILMNSRRTQLQHRLCKNHLITLRLFNFEPFWKTLRERLIQYLLFNSSYFHIFSDSRQFMGIFNEFELSSNLNSCRTCVENNLKGMKF